MKTKRTLTIATVFVALAMFMTLGVSGAGPYASKSEYSAARTKTETRPLYTASLPTPGALKTYKVRPSDTDGSSDDSPFECPGPLTAIGRELCWIQLDANGVPEEDNDGNLVSSAPNNKHVLYVPEGMEQTGNLLLFLPGAPGNPDQDQPGEPYHNLYPVMATQGYHVLALSTFTGGVGTDCHKEVSCFGKYMLEGLTGEDTTRTSRLSEHPQDSLLNRLVRVLEWASDNHPEDGWDRYLIPQRGGGHLLNWSRINLAGFSGGSSYASFMGTLYPVGRVVLFAGPNDGKGPTEEEWARADYIQRIAGVTDTRYYGLVHELNWTDRGDTFKPVLYEVTEAWRGFGMEKPFNPEPFWFDPQPGFTHDFLNSHMLISRDPQTSAGEAHVSVVRGEYKNCDAIECSIGYEPAWRCILGTGDASVSSTPGANAGRDMTAECRGNGGATISLDGSRSKDWDCDVLTYAWIGPFCWASGRTPRVFFPLGTSTVSLTVSDPWVSSVPDTMTVKVSDTKPPSLQVTLTPTILSPSGHQLVHIHASVSIADKCGDAPPQVVLTSITSSEPDSGVGPGDVSGDIQGADVGTLDQSFVLRAEAFGNGRHARTYTITYTASDASGNSTQFSAKVYVTNSRSR